MIKSITFEKSSEGYINRKSQKTVPRKGYTWEEIDTLKNNANSFERRRIEEKYLKTVADGYTNELARKSLSGKTFEFDENKINIIFGPNGCGKSTLLKCLANHCLCGTSKYFDGFTNYRKFEPLDWGLFDNPEFSEENLIKKLNNLCGNPCVIDWDGNPTYFENFGSREIRSIGDEEGSLFNGGQDGFLYLWNRSKISSGQNSVYLFNKLVNICKNPITIEQIEESYNNETKGWNTNWINVLSCNLNYIKSKYKEKTKITILLDEPDKHFDISLVIRFYKEILPKLVDKYNIQIITISHNPLILSSMINEDKYKIISLNKKYTKECKKMLSDLNFK